MTPARRRRSSRAEAQPIRSVARPLQPIANERRPPSDAPAGGRMPRYGTVASGTMCFTALALPRTSPASTVTGTGGVSLNR